MACQGTGIGPGSPSATSKETHTLRPATRGRLSLLLLDTVPSGFAPFHAPMSRETRGPHHSSGHDGVSFAVCLLRGVFPAARSRWLQRNLAFLAIVGQDRPDFRTSAISQACISRHARTCLCKWCVWRPETGLVRLGNVSNDGRKLGQCVAAQGHELWVEFIPLSFLYDAPLNHKTVTGRHDHGCVRFTDLQSRPLASGFHSVTLNEYRSSSRLRDRVPRPDGAWRMDGKPRTARPVYGLPQLPLRHRKTGSY